MSDRLGVVGRFSWPEMDGGLVAMVLGWLLVLTVLGAASWWVLGLLGEAWGRPSRAGVAALDGGEATLVEE